jgi:hypothetical protein
MVNTSFHINFVQPPSSLHPPALYWLCFYLIFGLFYLIHHLIHRLNLT